MRRRCRPQRAPRLLGAPRARRRRAPQLGRGARPLDLSGARGRRGPRRRVPSRRALLLARRQRRRRRGLRAGDAQPLVRAKGGRGRSAVLLRFVCGEHAGGSHTYSLHTPTSAHLTTKLKLDRRSQIYLQKEISEKRVEGSRNRVWGEAAPLWTAFFCLLLLIGVLRGQARAEGHHHGGSPLPTQRSPLCHTPPAHNAPPAAACRRRRRGRTKRSPHAPRPRPALLRQL